MIEAAAKAQSRWRYGTIELDGKPVEVDTAIHAGEYLVASHIEQHYKRVNVWIPSRDTGVDLLISDSRSQQTLRASIKTKQHEDPISQD